MRVLHHLIIYVIKENDEILHQIPLQELFNLRWYIQHLADESEDENQNPLSEENWMLQANWKSLNMLFRTNIQ